MSGHIKTVEELFLSGDGRANIVQTAWNGMETSRSTHARLLLGSSDPCIKTSKQQAPALSCPGRCGAALPSASNLARVPMMVLMPRMPLPLAVKFRVAGALCLHAVDSAGSHGSRGVCTGGKTQSRRCG